MTRARPPAFRGVVFAVAAFAAWPAFAEAAITAVPPAAYRAPSTQKSAPVTMMLPQGAPAARVALPEPTAAERASLRARNAAAAGAQGKATTLKGLAVAFPRSIPDGSRAVALAALPWQALGDGSRAAKLDVVSPGAAALRVALALSANVPGVTLRFTGNGANAQPFGPVAANDAAAAARFGEFWSPVLAGDVGTIEFHVASGAKTPDAILTLIRISHQVVAPASLTKLDAKAVEDIGASGSCNIDVARDAEDAGVRRQHERRRCHRADEGRRLHVPLYGDAAQRFAVEQHTLPVFGEPLHRFGNRRANAEYVLFFRRRRVRQQVGAGVHPADERRCDARA
jgi:hypothetical protein